MTSITLGSGAATDYDSIRSVSASVGKWAIYSVSMTGKVFMDLLDLFDLIEERILASQS